jgi:hypothetical protein
MELFSAVEVDIDQLAGNLTNRGALIFARNGKILAQNGVYNNGKILYNNKN